jgi:hypothetical protein
MYYKMRKKLKLGDIVRVNFIGSTYVCEITEVVDKTTYKARNMKTGVIIPNLRWKAHKDKKSVKSTKSIDTRKQTTKKSELDQAIKKQKDFIKGNIKK